MEGKEYLDMGSLMPEVQFFELVKCKGPTIFELAQELGHVDIDALHPARC